MGYSIEFCHSLTIQLCVLTKMIKTARSNNLILVIDDNPEDLSDLIGLLIADGMYIRIANDAMTGSQLADLHLPDLILLDVNMPSINGFSVAKILKNNEKTQNIPIIFISSANDDASRIEGLTVGAMDYITKPFNLQEALLRVKINLQRKERNKLNQLVNIEVSKELATMVEIAQHIDQTSLSNFDKAILKSVCEYLITHIANPPLLKEVAHSFGTNEKKLTKLFYDVFSISVFVWLRQQRLNISCDLLKTRKFTIGQISELLGYTSQSYFTKSFRESLNCTPTEYMDDEND